MRFENQTVSDLLGKNREKSQAAAKAIINTPDIEAWKYLLDNADFVFSFIKEKAGNAIAAEINKGNTDKVFELMKYHESDWDDYIARGLSHISDDEISQKMLELLSQGTMPEKTYASRYFCHVQYQPATDTLFEASKGYSQQLKSNSAEALGILQHQESYDYNIEQLKSEDEWDKIEAAQFLANYGNREAVLPILVSMENSGMAELIAGEIATLIDLYELFEKDDEKTRILALEALDNIISGIPEVWSLRAILDFKLYECVDTVINLAKAAKDAHLSGRYAQILLKVKQKFSLFVNNSQYTYDEEKDIMAELDEIYHLLVCESDKFWNNQIQLLFKELEYDDKKRKLSAIALINDMDLKDSVPHLFKLAQNADEDETVLCEAVIALAKMGQAGGLNKDEILSRIQDPNLNAVAQSSLGQKSSF